MKLKKILWILSLLPCIQPAQWAMAPKDLLLFAAAGGDISKMPETHICPHCNQAFKFEQNLEAHKVLHENPRVQTFLALFAAQLANQPETPVPTATSPQEIPATTMPQKYDQQQSRVEQAEQTTAQKHPKKGRTLRGKKNLSLDVETVHVKPYTDTEQPLPEGYTHLVEKGRIKREAPDGTPVPLITLPQEEEPIQEKAKNTATDEEAPLYQAPHGEAQEIGYQHNDSPNLLYDVFLGAAEYPKLEFYHNTAYEDDHTLKNLDSFPTLYALQNDATNHGIFMPGAWRAQEASPEPVTCYAKEPYTESHADNEQKLSDEQEAIYKVESSSDEAVSSKGKLSAENESTYQPEESYPAEDPAYHKHKKSRTKKCSTPASITLQQHHAAADTKTPEENQALRGRGRPKGHYLEKNCPTCGEIFATFPLLGCIDI